MKQQSQASIGRALGLSPASMTKYKNMGMPVDCVQNAHAWRQRNIKPSMHTPASRGMARQAPAKPVPSGAVANVHALMGIAAFALAGGQSITSMVPTLRAAMAAVQARERDAVLVSGEVMDVLTATVAAAFPPEDAPGEDNPAYCNPPMSEEQAQDMGRFWYQVAAGEVCNG